MTGDYVFNLFLRFLLEEAGDRYKLIYQYHDECLGRISKDDKEFIKQKALIAKERMNKMLKLNVEIDIDIKFGINYAETH